MKYHRHARRRRRHYKATSAHHLQQRQQRTVDLRKAKLRKFCIFFDIPITDPIS
jgi:hypothetical protein